MAHKYEFVATGGGFKVKNNGVTQTVISQSGSIVPAGGTSLPSGAGYEKGALYNLTNTADGSTSVYINVGTNLVTNWRLLVSASTSSSSSSSSSSSLSTSTSVSTSSSSSSSSSSAT